MRRAQAVMSELKLRPPIHREGRPAFAKATARQASSGCLLSWRSSGAGSRGLRASFPWWRNRRRLLRALAAGDGGDDLAAVEASILDENFAGVKAADEDSGDVDAGDVGLEGFEIDARLARFGIEFDAGGFEELEVGMVAGHGESVESGERFGAVAVLCVLDDDFAGFEADDFGIEARGDFAGFDAIFNVRTHPKFQTAAKLSAAVNKRDARTAAK